MFGKTTKVCAVLALCGILLLTTGCGNVTSIPVGTVECIGDVAQVFTDQGKAERLLNILQTGFGCANPVKDLIGQLNGTSDKTAVIKPLELPLLPTPTIQVNQSNASSFAYTWTSSVYDNCASNQDTNVRYSYSIPLTLVVGNKDQGLTTFVEPIVKSSPTSEYILFPKSGQFLFALTDETLIANAISTKYQFVTNIFANSESDHLDLTIPSHTKVQLNLPLAIQYTFGEGIVNHQGQASPGMLWAFTSSFDYQSGFDKNHLTSEQMQETPC